MGLTAPAPSWVPERIVRAGAGKAKHSTALWGGGWRGPSAAGVGGWARGWHAPGGGAARAAGSCSLRGVHRLARHGAEILGQTREGGRGQRGARRPAQRRPRVGMGPSAGAQSNPATATGAAAGADGRRGRVLP